MQIDPRYPLVREKRSMMTMYAVSDSRRTGVKVLAPGDALQITNNGMPSREKVRVRIAPTLQGLPK